MACHLVLLDKSPGVLPVEIGEALHRALAKIVMRAAGEQAKTACDNIQLCAGLYSRIEVGTHAVGQRQLEGVRQRRCVQEARIPDEDEEKDEAAGEEMLTVKNDWKEEEAEDILEDALGMEVKE